MKILMLCDSMRRGGAETHVLTLCRELARRGHALTVLSCGGELAEDLMAFGVEHIIIPLSSRRIRDILACRRYMSRLLMKERFDIIHSHSRLASTLVCPLARRHKIALVTTVHARFSLTTLRRSLSRWGELSIAVSEDLKQYLTDSYGVVPENISVIHNGVDGEMYKPKSRRGELTVGFLSRLDGDSSLGAELLCAISPILAREFEGVRIIIGGGGDCLGRVSKLAKGANRLIGRECVCCLGEIGDTTAFFNSCDLFVGVSRAAVEAALCGTAVVLCGNEGFSGELDAESFALALYSNFCCRGCEIPERDTLLHAVESLLSRGRERLAQRGEELRALALEHCSAQSAAEQTERVYCRAARIYEESAGSLLCGYYGFGNMGDDILLRAAIERARVEFPGEGVRAMTYRGRSDLHIFGARCVRRSSPFSALLALAKCKRLIFGGGTLLQSDTSLRSLIYYSALLIAARLMGKQCVLWGNGLGRARGRLDRMLICRALRSCDFIGVRDLRSFAIAKHTLRVCEGERGEVSIILEGDLAERAPSLYSTRQRADFLLRRAFGNKPSEIVAAMPRGKSDEGEILRLSKALSAERGRGRELLVIVMNQKEDERLCRALAASLGGKLMTGICFGDVTQMMKECKRAYSMRLHGLVAARMAGIEFVGIGEDSKIRGYCEQNGGRYLPVEENE